MSTLCLDYSFDNVYVIIFGTIMKELMLVIMIIFMVSILQVVIIYRCKSMTEEIKARELIRRGSIFLTCVLFVYFGTYTVYELFKYKEWYSIWYAVPIPMLALLIHSTIGTMCITSVR